MGLHKTAIATPSVMRLTAGATVVEFMWATDRWRHEIRTPGGRVWKSVEGVSEPDGDPCWPRSPVLTDVSLQAIAGKPALLGVGLAGRSHFSLCVTVHTDLEETLLFEAACRIHSAVGWLGSTYAERDGNMSRLEQPSWVASPPATICWNYTCGPSDIVTVPPRRNRPAGG